MHEMRGLGYEEPSSFTEAQRAKYRARFVHTIGLLEKILQEGIEQGSIRQCNVHKAAHGLFSVIVMMVFQGFVDNHPDSIKGAANSIADIFLYGVAERKEN